jgi:hypothetical protein
MYLVFSHPSVQGSIIDFSIENTVIVDVHGFNKAIRINRYLLDGKPDQKFRRLRL